MAPAERDVFDFGLGEMLVIAVLVIVFVGPEGLPDMMRVLGKFYAQIRRASDDLRRTFNAEVARSDADKRREELKVRREARERARDQERAQAAAEPGAALPEAPPEDAAQDGDDDEDELLLPPDPRLPPDAAPRRVPTPSAKPAAPRAAPLSTPPAPLKAAPLEPPASEPPASEPAVPAPEDTPRKAQ